MDRHNAVAVDVTIADFGVDTASAVVVAAVDGGLMMLLVCIVLVVCILRLPSHTPVSASLGVALFVVANGVVIDIVFGCPLSDSVENVVVAVVVAINERHLHLKLH